MNKYQMCIFALCKHKWLSRLGICTENMFTFASFWI